MAAGSRGPDQRFDFASHEHRAEARPAGVDDPAGSRARLWPRLPRSAAVDIGMIRKPAPKNALRWIRMPSPMLRTESARRLSSHVARRRSAVRYGALFIELVAVSQDGARAAGAPDSPHGRFSHLRHRSSHLWDERRSADATHRWEMTRFPGEFERGFSGFRPKRDWPASCLKSR